MYACILNEWIVSKSNMSIDSIDFIAGLSRLIWQAQIEFWGQHLKAIHESTSSGDFSHDKLHQYKAKIRLLHNNRDQCLPGHRVLYFHQDVEAFLNTATSTQMRQYLHHYEPAIYASMKTARSQPRHTLLTFPGFNRTVSKSSRPRVIPADTPPNLFSTGNRGVLLNRKHTRWRNPGQVLTSIRDFFLSPTPPG